MASGYVGAWLIMLFSSPDTLIGGTLPPNVHYMAAPIAVYLMLYLRDSAWINVIGILIMNVITQLLTAFVSGAYTNYPKYADKKLFYAQHAFAMALIFWVVIYSLLSFVRRSRNRTDLTIEVVNVEHVVSIVVITIACTSFIEFKVWTADLHLLMFAIWRDLSRAVKERAHIQGTPGTAGRLENL
jgi:hypothetical protein